MIEEKGAQRETASRVSIPSKLKATIGFGYDAGMKYRLGSTDFDKWIEGAFTHTQAHYRHPSLGTIIEFQVC